MQNNCGNIGILRHFAARFLALIIGLRCFQRQNSRTYQYKDMASFQGPSSRMPSHRHLHFNPAVFDSNFDLCEQSKCTAQSSYGLQGDVEIRTHGAIGGDNSNLDVIPGTDPLSQAIESTSFGSEPNSERPEPVTDSLLAVARDHPSLQPPPSKIKKRPGRSGRLQCERCRRQKRGIEVLDQS